MAKTSIDEVRSRVYKAIEAAIADDPSVNQDAEITDEICLSANLGCDSLVHMEILEAVAEEFDMESDALSDWSGTTVGSLVAYTHKNLR